MTNSVEIRWKFVQEILAEHLVPAWMSLGIVIPEHKLYFRVGGGTTIPAAYRRFLKGSFGEGGMGSGEWTGDPDQRKLGGVAGQLGAEGTRGGVVNSTEGGEPPD